ncbi:MAG: ATP phosphoribosyltransferase [Gammaproteobacteria bacterium]
MQDRDTPRLKIAVQKSGRLTDHCLDLLSRCGLKYTQSKDQLFCFGENMPIDILLVRDDDIPGLVADDVCDLGIAGLNVIHEKRLHGDGNGSLSRFEVVRGLDFGHCRLCIAAPEDTNYDGPASLAGRRIATSYPGILGDYLARAGIEADIVHFSGAVEIAPRLGRADFICDLVSTGSTLAANQLREVETVLESEAALIRTAAEISPWKLEWIDRLLMRIEGVQQVRESKYIMLHAPRSALAEITRLLPGSEAPTILPLEGREDRVAVHAVCRENVFWETLENLKEAGASAMLVLPVEKMLA